MTQTKKPLLLALNGKQQDTPPIWLMRQAGRYLPEYRQIRATAPSFLDFCYTPKLATEATLQPIKRFGFDAAILFSDILVIPDALGQDVSFETGEGPRLKPIETIADFKSLKSSIEGGKLDAVYETVQRVKSALPKETALIGFCGAPWTVASYMIAGRGTPDQAPARKFSYAQPKLFAKLIDLLTQASIDYLIAQLKSGVEVVQIFDSWAGVLPPLEFDRWCYDPVVKIINGVRASVPDAKMIAFPRGATSQLEFFSSIEGLSCLGLDTSVDTLWAADNLTDEITLQGNLDPLALLAGGHALDEAVDYILETMGDRPHIFNLGHGILPETPIAHVEQLLKRVRSGG